MTYEARLPDSAGFRHLSADDDEQPRFISLGGADDDEAPRFASLSA